MNIYKKSDLSIKFVTFILFIIKFHPNLSSHPYFSSVRGTDVLNSALYLFYQLYLKRRNFTYNK